LLVSIGCHLVVSSDVPLNSSSKVHDHCPDGDAMGGVVPVHVLAVACNACSAAPAEVAPAIAVSPARSNEPASAHAAVRRRDVDCDTIFLPTPPSPIWRPG
jgi:hypothetical protein